MNQKLTCSKRKTRALLASLGCALGAIAAVFAFAPQAEAAHVFIAGGRVVLSARHLPPPPPPRPVVVRVVVAPAPRYYPYYPYPRPAVSVHIGGPPFGPGPGPGPGPRGPYGPHGPYGPRPF